MRGEIIGSLLELINKFENKEEPLLFKLFFCGYATSYRRLWSLAYKGGMPRESKQERDVKAERCFRNTVNYLRRQGLVERKIRGRKKSFSLTKKGYRKLIFLGRPYDIKKDGVRRLIIFDVPEVERKKRDWLREEVKKFGFKMVQKSVWLGESPLSEDFLEDLRYMGLLGYVNIYRLYGE